VADDPIHRVEFEGYIRRHDSDVFAHAPMRHALRNEFIGEGNALDRRLTAVERLVWMGLGMALLLGAVIAGGTVSLVIELARGK